VACVARSGWLEQEADAWAAFVTFTAPGVDVLPWDKSLCSHRKGVRCSGKLGCRARVDELQVWNDSLGQRWSWLVTYVRRAFPGVDVQFFKAVEPQKRGALHLHVMFRLSGMVDFERFEAVMREVAARWGFGPETDVQRVKLGDGREVARTAGYVSKYAAKLADTDRSFVNTATGEIVTLRCRAWSKSGDWGDTMRGIAERRCDYARAHVGGQVAPPGVTATAAPGGSAATDLDLNSDCYTTGPILKPPRSEFASTFAG